MTRSLLLALVLCVLLALAVAFSSPGNQPAPTPTPAPLGRAASSDELLRAETEWWASAHADTYDNGTGANTTCARCKSPANWDPLAPAAGQELNCASCKRLPGAPRPDLSGGVAVPRAQWQNITCEVCHEPVGDSYLTSISFWDPVSDTHEPVASVSELCAKCHEGRHGFEVTEEQAISPAHRGWECTRCHGPHGQPASCATCHDPTAGAGAEAHARHTQVNCTACHDAGGLPVGLETDPASQHAGTYVTRRFAHTITAWPSHDLQRAADCRRCHHPQSDYRAAVAEQVSCDTPQCHPNGAVLNWCPAFPRNDSPEASAQP